MIFYRNSFRNVCVNGRKFCHIRTFDLKSNNELSFLSRVEINFHMPFYFPYQIFAPEFHKSVQIHVLRLCQLFSSSIKRGDFACLACALIFRASSRCLCALQKTCVCTRSLYYKLGAICAAAFGLPLFVAGLIKFVTPRRRKSNMSTSTHLLIGF